MTSFLHRSFRYVLSRIWDLLNPRAIMWRHIKKRHPNKAMITKLGKGLKVRIYTHDIIGKDIYVKGMFEKAECMFVTGFLKPGMTFFDIGANLGQYTLIGAECVGGSGHVHSFEPSSRMFSELNFNVSLNGLSNVCNLNNVAVSDKEGIAKLSKYEAGGEVFGSLGNQNWAESGKSIVGYEEVKTITLDNYIHQHGIRKIDLIKMDIEGAELFALQGARQLLQHSHAPVIVLEMVARNTEGFGYKPAAICDYLKEFGYRLYCFNKRGRISGLLPQPSDTDIVADYSNVVARKQ